MRENQIPEVVPGTIPQTVAFFHNQNTTRKGALPQDPQLFLKTRMGMAEITEALLSRLPPPATARPRLMSRGETTACGLGCRRCWWWWALSSTPRLWSVSLFRVTAAESEQFEDVRACTSKQQIQHARGNESRGRSRMGLQNPLSGETNKQGMYLDRWTKQKISSRKKRKLARNGRNARLERRRMRGIRRMTRARSRTGEFNVTTWYVRSLSITGRHGAEQIERLFAEM